MSNDANATNPPADRAGQHERQLRQAQQRLAALTDELATAEAQRDEALQQVTVTENRSAAERLLAEAGVADVEAARVLLERRTSFDEPLEAEQLTRGVEELLLDKPFLRAASVAGSLPPSSASARDAGRGGLADLAEAGRRAAATGNRRDVAEYLRLRRHTARA